MIKIKLVRSLCGTKKDQVDTAKSLKLKRIGDVSIQPDNPATQGKIKKIVHLIETCEVEG